LMVLATLPEDERVQVRALAQQLSISENHLIKVVHQLGKQGWLLTYRGKGGGFCLAPAAFTVSIGDVVRALEPSVTPIDCFRPTCPLQGACSLERLLWQAQAAYLQQLDAVRLADLSVSEQLTRLNLALQSS